MNTSISPKATCLFLIFVVLGIYYPVIFAPLTSVDDVGMYGYMLNADSLTLKEIFTPRGGQYFRPLLELTFYLDRRLWGLEESFMHLDNILFHLINVLLVFAIARTLWRQHEECESLAPMVVALLFALHPLNVESVAWISGRTDLIAGNFIFLSMYILFAKDQWQIPALHSVAAATCILLACLAKETAVFMLPAAMVLPFFTVRSPGMTVQIKAAFRKNWAHILIFFSAGISYLLFRTGGLSRHDDGIRTVASHVGGGDGGAVAEKVFVVIKSAGFYLKKLFVPFPLNFGIIHVSDLYFLVGLVLLPLGLWWVYRRTLESYLFVCAVSVGSSALLIPLLKITWTPLAERYMYLSSAFFLIGVVLVVDRRVASLTSKHVVVAGVAAVCGIAAYGTVTRNLVWQDNLVLYQDTVRKSPDFVPAQNELANALIARGRDEEGGKILTSMKLADDLNNVQLGHVNRAMRLSEKGEFDHAKQLLEQILEKPGRHQVMILKKLVKVYDGQLLAHKGDRVELLRGMQPLLERLSKLTGDPFYSYRLGQIHMHLGDKGAAHTAFLDAAIRAPDKAHYHDAACKLADRLGSDN